MQLQTINQLLKQINLDTSNNTYKRIDAELTSFDVRDIDVEVVEHLGKVVDELDELESHDDNHWFLDESDVYQEKAELLRKVILRIENGIDERSYKFAYLCKQIELLKANKGKHFSVSDWRELVHYSINIHECKEYSVRKLMSLIADIKDAGSCIEEFMGLIPNTDDPFIFRTEVLDKLEKSLEKILNNVRQVITDNFSSIISDKALLEDFVNELIKKDINKKIINIGKSIK